MAVAILLYNIVYTAILTLAVACAYYLRKRKGKNIFAVVGAMFGIYLVDNTIVFCTESIADFSVKYDTLFLSSPSFKTVYFVALMGCMVYLIYTIMRPPTPVPFYVLIGVYGGLLICIPMIPNDRWMVFFYYLPTQVYWIGLSLWGLLALHHKAQWYCQPFYKTFRRILVYMLVVSCLILLEDSLVIFLRDVYTQLGLKINNRNWSENLLFLGLACFFIKYTVVVLEDMEVHLLGPMEPETLSQRKPGEAFGLVYGLTERECQILELLLEGKSQQDICDELTIALGTVKTHIHNIYQKMDVTKRGQLMALYQKFKEESMPPA